VAKSTLEEEKIEIEKWRGYAIDFNKNSGFRFWRN
jgi:hypothetical protein